MDKIPTLFVRDKRNMSVVTREPNPDALWVFEGEGEATVKKDGTNIAVSVITAYGENQLDVVYKRRNPSRKEKDFAFEHGMPKPEPTYVRALRFDPADKHIFAAVDRVEDWYNWPVGIHSCEALGPKIQGGVESDVPMLYVFSLWPEKVRDLPYSWVDANDLYEMLDNYFREQKEPIEGIVWHHEDGKRMAKIKRRDFGLPWPPKK